MIKKLFCVLTFLILVLQLSASGLFADSPIATRKLRYQSTDTGELIEMLQRQDRRWPMIVRDIALELASRGPLASNAISALEGWLPERYACWAAAYAIKKIDPSRSDMLQFLALEVKKETGVAAQEPGKLAADFGEEIVPLLIPCLTSDRAMSIVTGVGDVHTSNDINYSVAWTLGQIGSQAIPGLTKALKNKDARTRRGVAEAFKIMGQQGSAAIPALLKAKDDGDKNVRWAVYDALAAVGKGNKEVISALEWQRRKHMLIRIITGRFLLMFVPFSSGLYDDVTVLNGSIYDAER